MLTSQRLDGARNLSPLDGSSYSGRYHPGMTTADGLPAIDEHADLWLTHSELASWLSVVRLITQLN